MQNLDVLSINIVDRIVQTSILLDMALIIYLRYPPEQCWAMKIPNIDRGVLGNDILTSDVGATSSSIFPSISLLGDYTKVESVTY